jgi:mono/diheme cytochrome c family protein
MTVTALGTLAAAVTLLLAFPARAEPPKRTPELVDKGKASFAKNCVACHGPNGEGDGKLAKNLNPRPRNFLTEPFQNGPGVDKVFETLSNGRPGTAMVAFRGLPEEERWALAYYVLSLKEQGKQ